MATFKIGQRVKKVRHPPHNDVPALIPIGTEGIVVGFGDDAASGGRYVPDITVRYGTTELDSLASCWEPIQYDGMQKIEWSQCMWLPEHMREKLDENVKEAA